MLTSHPPFDTRIFHREAKTLVAAGYKVTLVVPHDRRETVEGVEIVPVSKPRNRFQSLAGGLRMLLPALRQGADVYHFHDPDLLLTGVLLKLLTGRPVIYDVHENHAKAVLSPEKHWVPRAARVPLARGFDFFEKLCARNFDAVIAAAEDIGATFKHHRVLSVRNYPPLGAFGKGPNARKNGYALVYYGSLTRTRGTYEIVKSLGLIDPRLSVTLSLGGRFHEEHYERLVRGLPEFEKVEFLGWLAFDEVLKEASRCDVALACFLPDPNLDTGVHRNLKLFEYMMLGLPVIVGNARPWRDFVASHQCGLSVDSRSPEEIARAVETLLKNPSLRRKMGENGRNAVRARYNWEREKQTLLDVYSDLFEGFPR